ncbi:COBRA-like protein 2 [Abeliophyllum distichum]|uniref:COBRA-like protein n=1 Tax=Abeliophyllum distichum TaxID=126358 RepID=A0ABD1RQE5_9LAMI
MFKKLFFQSQTDCYDPLDSNGNITVTFDIKKYTLDGYVARVTIQNYYQYRHVEKPGWKLGWTWAKNEVIWSMYGAFAVQQGNCSSFKFQVPHSCKKDPVIVDLMPDTMPQNRTDGCCNGGVLSAWAINPLMSYSSFEVTVGNLEQNSVGYKPLNLTLMAPGPGYTCGPVMDTDPTVSSLIGGRRQEQIRDGQEHGDQPAHTPVIWLKKHQFVVFRSQHFTTLQSHHVPSCSCGCRIADELTTSCVRQGSFPSNLLDADLVQCTDHMCPLRVHWHIKKNYPDHWRVKLTISNYNYGKNYSDWNVLVQHPGFGQPATAYSFNSKVLPTSEEVAIFWGIFSYNSELVQAGENQLGSVTTEILLQKDSKSFTLRNGWAFPRRIYFNGDNCQMPLPDIFPMLPNGSPRRKPSQSQFVLLTAVYLWSISLATFFWL